MNISDDLTGELALCGDGSYEQHLAKDLVKTREELARFRKAIEMVGCITNSYRHDAKRNEEEAAKIEDIMSWRHGFFTGRAGGIAACVDSVDRTIETWTKAQ